MQQKYRKLIKKKTNNCLYQKSNGRNKAVRAEMNATKTICEEKKRVLQES